MKKTVSCHFCGKEFEVEDNDQVYCVIYVCGEKGCPSYIKE